MTLPDERLNSVDTARHFLVSLMNPEFSPGVPGYIREEARNRLRHYPHSYDTDRWRELDKVPPPKRPEGVLEDKREVLGYNVGAMRKHLEDSMERRREYYKSIFKKAYEKEKKEDKRKRSNKKRKT